MSGTGNQGRGCGPELGHHVFASVLIPMSVGSGCWKVCWVSRRRLVEFAKCYLNGAVMSVKMELRHLQIDVLVPLKKLPWGGLQWAATCRRSGLELLLQRIARVLIGVFFYFSTSNFAGEIRKEWGGGGWESLRLFVLVKDRRFISSPSWLTAGWSLPASTWKPTAASGRWLESCPCRAQAHKLLLQLLQVLSQFS